MLGCELLLDIPLYFLHLPLTARFVDRDMLMRFLGYGIGHKDQTNRIVSPDEAGYEASPEEDPPNTMRIAYIQNEQPLSNVSNQVARNDIQDGDDDQCARDSDAGCDNDPDDEDDLYGHF